jgi:hypothetical protein
VQSSLQAADLVHHEIAAGNIFLGDSVFLSLALPKSWDLSIGAGRPEITASHERNGRRWVATGDAWYVLHDTGRRWAMEVRLTVKPAGQNLPEIALPTLWVAGHAAEVTWQRRRRGFIRRWSVTYVTVQFHCPKTERRLRLEFSGRIPDEAFQEMIEAVRYVRCH